MEAGGKSDVGLARCASRFEAVRRVFCVRCHRLEGRIQAPRYSSAESTAVQIVTSVTIAFRRHAPSGSMQPPGIGRHGLIRQRGRVSRGAWKLLALLVVVISISAAAAAVHLREDRMRYRLLVALPNDAASDPALVRFAAEEAAPVYSKHCAACHGTDMRGLAALGAPDLTDAVSLYGSGDVYDIERKLLYGIRSGESKGRDIADMPAYGLMGRLNSAQIRSVVEYVMQLSGRPFQPATASDGRDVFFGDANCGDCHGPDARGNPDYGAPDLTVNVWNSGGDPQSLYDSIYFGRHRVMPAWRGILSLDEIRALAVYLYAASHPPQPPAAELR